MKKFFINNATQLIEISESFSKKAGNYNSPEYSQLKDAKSTYPNYQIKILKSSSATSKHVIKGLTLEIMRKYVEKHNEDNFLEHFNSLVENKTSYFEIKDEVLKHYPQCRTYKNKAEWILAA